MRTTPKPKRQEPRSLSEAIRSEREARGWSQSKLARVLETTEKNVRNWESGRIYPSWPHYVRMCLAFGWPLPYGGGEPQEQATPP